MVDGRVRRHVLEDEYAKLKKLLADQMLEATALKELLSKECMVRPVRAKGSRRCKW
ncbi:hypothetical protein [Mesorhizobium sp. M0139]|uniref:hypothetical protein n=1 Tax=Mesorhizobium sp. M0139 TaxID=2956892 RepID=UPI00333DAC1C